jgi:hypothetical protein
MRRESTRSGFGYSALAGGAFGLALAPVMVAIKYMTGWAVIPEPTWVPVARTSLHDWFHPTTPAQLWMAFGSGYTVALLLMLIGVVGMRRQMMRAPSRLLRLGYWVLVGGICLVIPGDAIHTWTWHQHGLTTPTPGTNPLANTAYAVHMMGMNFVMLGSLLVGLTALRRKYLARWLAVSFLLVFPSAVLASVTVLPTTPSGALWFFSAVMMAYGYGLVSGEPVDLDAPA